jgi:hypothetical protein
MFTSLPVLLALHVLLGPGCMHPQHGPHCCRTKPAGDMHNCINHYRPCHCSLRPPVAGTCSYGCGSAPKCALCNAGGHLHAVRRRAGQGSDEEAAQGRCEAHPAAHGAALLSIHGQGHLLRGGGADQQRACWTRVTATVTLVHLPTHPSDGGTTGPAGPVLQGHVHASLASPVLTRWLRGSYPAGRVVEAAAAGLQPLRTGRGSHCWTCS